MTPHSHLAISEGLYWAPTIQDEFNTGRSPVNWASKHLACMFDHRQELLMLDLSMNGSQHDKDQHSASSHKLQRAYINYIVTVIMSLERVRC